MDPDPGGLKTYGSYGSRSGSATYLPLLGLFLILDGWRNNSLRLFLFVVTAEYVFDQLFFLGRSGRHQSPSQGCSGTLHLHVNLQKFKSKPTKKMSRLCTVLSNSPAQQRLTPTSPQGADPYPSTRGKAGRNHLNGEFTPLLPTGIGERF